MKSVKSKLEAIKRDFLSGLNSLELFTSLFGPTILVSKTIEGLVRIVFEHENIYHSISTRPPEKSRSVLPSPFNLFNAKDGLDRKLSSFMWASCISWPARTNGAAPTLSATVEGIEGQSWLLSGSNEIDISVRVCLPVWWDGKFEVLFWWHCKHLAWLPYQATDKLSSRRLPDLMHYVQERKVCLLARAERRKTKFSKSKINSSSEMILCDVTISLIECGEKR